MNTATVSQPRKRPPLRRLLAVALSGGLGVFAIAVDTTPIGKPQAPQTPASLSSTEQPDV